MSEDTAGTELDRALALDIVRVTEATAVAAARWRGRGDEAAADKAAAVTRLGAETTAFVGDGINDAPALAASAAGLAMGQGSDVAIEAGEVVLVSGDPRAVASAIRIARATMANIRQNPIWAFGYNTLLIPVAAGALYPAFGLSLTPMLAAGAMSLSSLFVVANALRLRRAG